MFPKLGELLALWTAMLDVFFDFPNFLFLVLFVSAQGGVLLF
jgi:hypothetical protein